MTTTNQRGSTTLLFIAWLSVAILAAVSIASFVLRQLTITRATAAPCAVEFTPAPKEELQI